jgi:hypothetical protein
MKRRAVLAAAAAAEFHPSRRVPRISRRFLRHDRNHVEFRGTDVVVFGAVENEYVALRDGTARCGGRFAAKPYAVTVRQRRVG